MQHKISLVQLYSDMIAHLSPPVQSFISIIAQMASLFALERNVIPKDTYRVPQS